jgi:hypothetical protein
VFGTKEITFVIDARQIVIAGDDGENDISTGAG